MTLHWLSNGITTFIQGNTTAEGNVFERGGGGGALATALHPSIENKE